jgi:hypothetical protein
VVFDGFGGFSYFRLMVLMVFGRWGIPYHSLFDFNQIWWFLVVLLVLFVFAVISIRFDSFWWFL